MNGPLFAAVLTIAAVGFVTWFAWFGIYEPLPAKGWLSFLAWTLPPFYLGGWAAGYSLGESTVALIMLVFFGFLSWIRTEAPSWGAKFGASIRNSRINRSGKIAESDAPE